MHKYEKSIIEGVSSETRFVNMLKNKQLVRHATKKEDILEHWDILYGTKKYDIKAPKRINRHNNYSMQFTWVEFQNVNGANGWIYGKADYIAFDFLNRWVIVSRIELKNMILSKIKVRKIMLKTQNVEPYIPYRRKNRRDIIILVPVKDIEQISEVIKYDITN